MAGKFITKSTPAKAGTGANVSFSTNFTAPKQGGKFIAKQPSSVGGMISKQFENQPGVFGGPSLPVASEFKPIAPRVQGESNADYWKGTSKNLLSSAGNILGGIYNVVSHPAQTAKSILDLTSGAGTKFSNKIISKVTGDTMEEVKARSQKSPVYKFMKDKLGIDVYANADKAATVGDFLVERYGGIEKIKKTFKEDPLGVIGDAASIVEGGAGFVGKLNTINKAGEVSKVAKIANTIRKGAETVNPYNQVPNLTIKTAKIPGKLLSASKDFALNQITGLSKDTRQFARKNPKITQSAMDGAITAENLAGEVKTVIDDINTNKTTIGKEYDTIRQGGGTINTAGVTQATNDKLFSLGVNVTDGKLGFSKFSKFNAPQQKALQSAYDIMMDVEKAGTVSADDLLNIRQKMDDLISRDGKPLKGSAVDKSTELAIREMRQNIDNFAKRDIKGLTELDAKYGQVLDEVGGLKKDWFDSQGNLKENALSKIRNLTSDANKQKLARLEKVMPGITQKSQALQAVMDIERATGSKVGTYIRGALMGGGGVAAMLNPGLLAPLIIGGIVLTPKNVIKAYQTLGKMDAKIKQIADKITKSIKLTVADEAFMKKWMSENGGAVTSAIEDINGGKTPNAGASKLNNMMVNKTPGEIKQKIISSIEK